jgi:hypothetical protein
MHPGWNDINALKPEIGGEYWVLLKPLPLHKDRTDKHRSYKFRGYVRHVKCADRQGYYGKYIVFREKWPCSGNVYMSADRFEGWLPISREIPKDPYDNKFP